jgi:vacuolar-type H+-ATPase subunit E/Vma4
VEGILGDPEAFLAEVRRRAQQRAAGIEQDARQQAVAISTEAKKEAESIRHRIESEAQQETAAAVRAALDRGELEARRRQATLREEAIGRVWAAAESRLRELAAQPSYRDVLKRLALQAARELGGIEVVLAADPASHELLSPETLGAWSSEAGVRFRRAPAPADTWGGLLATCGRNRVDATFPTRLASAQALLRERVFELLSGG